MSAINKHFKQKNIKKLGISQCRNIECYVNVWKIITGKEILHDGFITLNGK